MNNDKIKELLERIFSKEYRHWTIVGSNAIKYVKDTSKGKIDILISKSGSNDFKITIKNNNVIKKELNASAIDYTSQVERFFIALQDNENLVHDNFFDEILN